MTKPKHTKGPWNLSANFHQTGVILDSDGNEILRLCQYHRAKNAHLIAASPMMLEALEHCIAYFEHVKPVGCGVDDDRECSPYQDALIAIKKAEGRES